MSKVFLLLQVGLIANVKLHFFSTFGFLFCPALRGGGGMSGFSLPDGRGLGPRPSAREMVGNAGPEKKLKVN